jgi:hypothetical protein
VQQLQQQQGSRFPFKLAVLAADAIPAPSLSSKCQHLPTDFNLMHFLSSGELCASSSTAALNTTHSTTNHVSDIEGEPIFQLEVDLIQRWQRLGSAPPPPSSIIPGITSNI